MKNLVLMFAVLGTLLSPAMAKEFKYEDETLGGVKLGAPAAKVIEVWGKPEGKGEETEWGADGLFHQDWNYPKLGLVVGMAAEKAKGKQEVFSIAVEAPGTVETSFGIKIGSSVAEVKAAYGKAINEEESTKDSVVVGSVYGGVIFGIERGKVVSIFLGAAAE